MTDVQEHSLRVMDGNGDTKMTWGDNQAEIDAARHTFDEMKGKRYLAYTVKADGSRGEVIREFDPTAHAIIMAPQLVGG